MARVEVILLESRSKLGLIGDVVKVRAGYARNFLLPLGKALRSTERNRKVFEERRGELVRISEDRESVAKLLKEAMMDLRVTITRQAGVSGQLYGSVSSRDIAEALKEHGHVIDYHNIMLAKPIKSLGAYSIVLELNPSVTHAIQVDVVSASQEDQLTADQQTFVDFDEAPSEEKSAPVADLDQESTPDVEGAVEASMPSDPDQASES